MRPNGLLRNLSTIVFYDSKNRILLQDRRSISKFGEEWGPFGGSIEQGESPDEALVREIREELEFDLDVFELLRVYDEDVVNLDGSTMHVVENFYIAPFPGFDNLNQKEGDGMKLFGIPEARNLKVQRLYLRRFDDVVSYLGSRQD